MDGQDCLRLSLSPVDRFTFMCVGLYDLTGIKQSKICVQINDTSNIGESLRNKMSLIFNTLYSGNS